MKQHSWIDGLLPDRIDALLIAGGAAPNGRLLRSVAGRTDSIIAIDGGIRHVRALQLVPQIVIGDLDSAAPQELAWARGQRARVVFVREQDSSDIEKAMLYCRDRKFRHVVVAGIDGNRPDHFLYAVSRAPRWRGLRATFVFSDAIGIPLVGRKAASFQLPAGYILSWLGLPRATGCTMRGLKWPFANRVLDMGKFQSLSNRSTDEAVVISQRSGTSLIIIPLTQA